MSYRQSGPFDEIRNSFVRNAPPLTRTIVAINVVTFLINAVSNGKFSAFLVCELFGGHVRPIWGPLTYPLLSGEFLSLLLSCLWMWTLGGSLERSWGTSRFAIYFVAISVFTALAVDLGTRVLRLDYVLIGLWLPLTAITCSWAAINPREQLRYFGVFQLEARWLALITVAFTFFDGFQGAFVLGLFYLLSPLAAYYYVRGSWNVFGGRGYASRGPDLRMRGASGYRVTGREGMDRPTGIAGWWQDIQERRRLRRLLKDTRYNDKNFRDR